MEKVLGHYKSVRLIRTLRKIMDQSLQAPTAKCAKNRAVKQCPGIYQRQIVPENRHSNIKMTGLVDGERNAVDVVHLNLSMVLCTVSIMPLQIIGKM